MLNKKLLGGSSGLPQDDNFENVTLLLNGDGTNGGQNNTFVDSSTNNFTITRNGNTTQGSFSPYGDLWSNYFPSGNNISFSEITQNSTWTIEFWYNINASGNNIVTWNSPAGTYYTGIYASSIIYSYAGTTRSFSFTSAVGTWYHLALVNNAGTLTCYVNGTQVGTSQTGPSVAYVSQVGGYGSGFDFAGYISNLRITNTAVYTANFTPSTTPLTAITGTQLLTCQSNRFLDNSSSARTITGNASVQRFSPFEPSAPYSTSVIGGSGYFDGSGDYLSTTGGITDNGTGDLCFEFWSYYTGSYSTEAVAFDSRTSPFTNGFAITSAQTSGYWTMNFASQDILTSTPTAKNAWQHIVLTRSGNTFRLFVDGILRGTLTSSNNLTSTTNVIGAAYNNGNVWIGYLSNMRCIKGSIPTEYQTSSTTLGTSVFTPPTAPVTAVSGTSVLLNYTNASIADLAMMNDLETVGNAQVSTSVKKYGTGSLAFDGTGDYLQARFGDPNWQLGAGDWTIECWVYLNSTSGQQGIIFGQSDYANAANASYEYYAIGGTSTVYSGGTAYTISSPSPTVSTWTHLALVRNGGTITSYVNGTSIGTANISTNAINIGTTNPPSIGAKPGGGNPLNGYIDDLRVTKGVARYTANFTPPASAHPTF